MARRKRKTKRRFMKRRRQNRPRGSAPPRLTLSANRTTLKLFGTLPVTDAGSNTLKLTVDELVAKSTSAALITAYNELRLLSVRIYYQSNTGTSSNGSVALVVADAGENTFTKAPFTSVCVAPGAMVRRVYQNVFGMWYPTEPSDKEFVSISDKSNRVTVVLCHSDPAGKFNGILLYEARVVVRGIAAKSTVVERLGGITLDTMDVRSDTASPMHA